MESVNKKRKRETLEEGNLNFIVPLSNNRDFDKSQLEEESLTTELFGGHDGFQQRLNADEPTETSDNIADKKSAWSDADDIISVHSAFKIQKRKLIYDKSKLKSAKYSMALANKYLTYHQTPHWATINTREGDYDSDEELLKTSGHLAKHQSTVLSNSILDFKNMSDLNAETGNEGPLITSVDFHQTSTVALVAGISGIVSIFAVDGKNNSKLHNIKLDNYPIERAKFLDTTEILISSRFPYVFSFDMILAKAVRVPLPSGITQCKRFEISPCKKIIAVIGKGGNIHLLSSRSKELITTLKQNFDVTDITFHPRKSLLFGHSVNGEVNIWNLSNHRIQQRWIDDGCLCGTNISISPSGQLVATGSSQGIVNLYDLDSTLNNEYPTTSKTVTNLTTSINCIKFNNTSEALAMSSSEINNSIKLLHLQSKTVYSNFPRIGSKLGCINFVSFSPNSGYLALANRNSRVLLYRLKHFQNY